MKRIVLLIATNLAVVLLLSVVASVLGIDRMLAQNGFDFFGTLMFAALFGFGGAFISLLISKWMAKRSTGAQVIDGTEGTTQYWLVDTANTCPAPEIGVIATVNPIPVAVPRVAAVCVGQTLQLNADAIGSGSCRERGSGAV